MSACPKPECRSPHRVKCLYPDFTMPGLKRADRIAKISANIAKTREGYPPLARSRYRSPRRKRIYFSKKRPSVSTSRPFGTVFGD